MRTRPSTHSCNRTVLFSVPRTELLVQPSHTDSRHQIDIRMPIRLLRTALRGMFHQIDDTFLAQSPQQYAVHVRHESRPRTLGIRFCETIGNDHDVFGESAELVPESRVLDGGSYGWQWEPDWTECASDASGFMPDGSLDEHNGQSLRSAESLDVLSRQDCDVFGREIDTPFLRLHQQHKLKAFRG